MINLAETANVFTKEIAIEIMKQRGYTDTYSAGQGRKYGFSRMTDIGPLSAEVDLQSRQITLSFVELVYLCQLKAESFDFFHKDFEKFENIIYLYAQSCKKIDPFKLLNDLNKPFEDNAPEEPKKSKKTLEDRKKEFATKVVDKAKEKGYSKELATAFYRHWSEHNEDGRLMRFEKERTFNIAGRLATWAANEEKFNKSRKNFTEKKIEQQNQSLYTSNTPKFDKNELF